MINVRFVILGAWSWLFSIVCTCFGLAISSIESPCTELGMTCDKRAKGGKGENEEIGGFGKPRVGKDRKEDRSGRVEGP